MTRPDHPDPTLRGRRYAIPFDAVWKATVGGIRTGSRWTLIEADDQKGVIRAEARTLILRRVHDVSIRVWLDADAQTRVDLMWRSRSGPPDLGGSARGIRRFLSDLDRGLGASPGTILPPEGGVLHVHGAHA